MSGCMVLMLGLCLALEASLAAPPESRNAGLLIRQYMEITLPDSGLGGPTRGERLQILERLTEIPEEAVPAVSAALSSTTRVVHRIELLEVLGRIHTRASADLLIQQLRDTDWQVRRQAIQSLRYLASRIRRCGVVDVPKEPEFPPHVEGLVPHLREAADDELEENRIIALFALADTRDSLALAELRDCLADPAERVRFIAACRLTEFGDASGLPELKRGLLSLADDKHGNDVRRYFDAQDLLASLQRITGENLGRIPLLPPLSSSMEGQRQAAEEYEALLDRWAEWWKQRQEQDK